MVRSPSPISLSRAAPPLTQKSRCPPIFFRMDWKTNLERLGLFAFLHILYKVRVTKLASIFFLIPPKSICHSRGTPMMMATFPRQSVDMMSAAVMEGQMAMPPPSVIGAMTLPISGSTWCRGSSTSVRRLSSKICTSLLTPRTLAIMLRYESTTPLGDPVVPEV